MRTCGQGTGSVRRRFDARSCDSEGTRLRGDRISFRSTRHFQRGRPDVDRTDTGPFDRADLRRGHLPRRQPRKHRGSLVPRRVQQPTSGRCEPGRSRPGSAGARGPTRPCSRYRSPSSASILTFDPLTLGPSSCAVVARPVGESGISMLARCPRSQRRCTLRATVVRFGASRRWDPRRGCFFRSDGGRVTDLSMTDDGLARSPCIKTPQPSESRVAF